MTEWQSIILYTFLCYLTFHLILDDILLIVKYVKNNNAPLNPKQ